jgi:protein-S-isoprenylcysteine O-methyltransferase Ste14
MAVKKRSAMGPFLYGALFVVLLPLAAVLWAYATRDLVGLTTVHLPAVGWSVAGGGLALMATSMLALRVWGGGLPMNAYPPPAYVRRGPYRLIRHPIYLGFGMVCFGTAVALGSASGLWLVSPVLALGMVALVVGYEGPDLRRRFGERAAEPPLVSLPPADAPRVTGWHRLSVFLLVLVPWTLAYEAVYRLGVPPDAIEAYLPFERQWPVLVWTEVAYASVYLFVGLVPLLVRRPDVLRRFAVNGLLATALVTFVYLVVPVVAPPKPFEGGGVLGRMLALERTMSHTVAAFPSFHVIWTLLAADAWSASRGRLAFFAWFWAAAISVSCITTGMHALADVVVAVPVWMAVREHARLWSWARRSAEAVANSWWEWQRGGIRVLGYGLYAGLAGGLGLWIGISWAGPDQLGGGATLALLGLLGAGLWAQKLEGSSALSRPFGYFGSLIGVSVGAGLAGVLGYDTSLLFAAITAAAPWIQGIGRLRCLVQGCCHGHEAPETLGIRYWDPRSRVCSLGGLRGRSLHPTPLYSILANAVLGVLLARLWTLGASEGVIAGTYMMGAGLSRFVEEAYRGEPQTPTVAGLRLYQWLAVILGLVGALTTTVARTPVPPGSFGFHPAVVATSVAYGLACFFAMGVDFPRSTRRFARLAPVE